MKRRVLLGGAGAAGLTGLGALLYSAAPGWWRQMAREAARPILDPPARPDPRLWRTRGLHAAWLGHSTVLISIDGFTILTDPIFSDRAGVHVGPLAVGLKRLVAPALPVEGLPKIDLVLLSHAHMDHFDIPSLRQLEDSGTTVITASNTSDLLRPGRYRAVHELAWGDRALIGPIECRAFEVKHWGARMRSDTYRGYNGYVVDAGRHRVLFAGDTALTPTFRSLRDSRAIDLAIMPIGSYNPWLRNHCTPEQAWRMGNDAGVHYFIPVHHQTFQLSREPLLEPIDRFYTVAGTDSKRVAMDQIGREFHLS